LPGEDNGILNNIEVLRNELNKLMDSKDVAAQEVLELSCRLDNLIVQFLRSNQ